MKDVLKFKHQPGHLKVNRE